MDDLALERRHRSELFALAGFENTTRSVGTEGAEFGAAHVTDVPLLLGGRESWGHTLLVGRSEWSDIDRRGRKVRQIWADFARTGTLAADAAAGPR